MPPFCVQSKSHSFLKCTGKNIADCVESVLGAFFMSNNLRKSLEFISDIGLIPLRRAHLLEMIPDTDLTFTLHEDIDIYKFDINDKVTDIFEKYMCIHAMPQQEQLRLISIIDPNKPIGGMGEAFNPFFASPELQEMQGR
jgi:hypothetical protein